MSRCSLTRVSALALALRVSGDAAHANSLFASNAQLDSSVSVWPQPQSMADSCLEPKHFMHFDGPASFNFDRSSKGGAQVLEEFLDAHIKPHMFPRHYARSSSGRTVDLSTMGLEFQAPGNQDSGRFAPPTIRYNISNPFAVVDFGIDESYEIVMAGLEWTVTSPTQVGAMYATDTLMQLVISTFIHDPPSGSDLPTYRAPSSCTIKDAPRFPWRGLLLDVGRHWLPPSAMLEDVLPAMRLNKLNVLHLHMTEDQSFPLISAEHPELALNGAFSPLETYSPRVLRFLVAEAKKLGIRIVPEYDMPGHSTSVSKSHPELFACTAQESSRGAYDPTKEETYEFLQGLLEEFSGSGGKAQNGGIFTDSFVHLGTDEVPTDCWKNIPTDPSVLFGWFIQRMGNFVIGSGGNGLGKTPIMWDESISGTGGEKNLPPKQAVIQIWRNWTASADATRTAIELGYRTIVSVDSAGYMNWYLDGPTAWDDRMYAADPVPAGLTPEQEKMVLGGEGAMWGERVDVSNLMNTIFPRMSAIAERLWSAKEVNDVVAALPRLQKFRCLMVLHGWAVEAVGGTGRMSPDGPGSCMQVHKKTTQEDVTSSTNPVIVI